ncbi:MAG: hypothetical protein ACOX20_09145 [Limnochordia bacterium]
MKLPIDGKGCNIHYDLGVFLVHDRRGKPILQKTRPRPCLLLGS